MSPLSQHRKMRFYKGTTALAAGCALNYFGDHLLGVKVELYTGLQGFGGMWILDMFALPFAVGLLVAFIFGLGGKWLSYFPPLIVRAIAYYQLTQGGDIIPQDATLIPMGWWGFFVILVMEASAFGGIIGEVMIKGTYGRSPRHLVYKGAPDKDEEDIEA